MKRPAGDVGSNSNHLMIWGFFHWTQWLHFLAWLAPEGVESLKVFVMHRSVLERLINHSCSSSQADPNVAEHWRILFFLTFHEIKHLFPTFIQHWIAFKSANVFTFCDCVSVWLFPLLVVEPDIPALATNCLYMQFTGKACMYPLFTLPQMFQSCMKLMLRLTFPTAACSH